MYKIWIKQNIYSVSVDRDARLICIKLIYKMNKHFYNYTSQTKKVKENFGITKKKPLQEASLSQVCSCKSLILILISDQIKIYFKMNSTASTYISALIFFSFALPVTTLMIT